MKSSEAAKFLGVSHRTFKYWVKVGKIIPDEVRKNNYRDYNYFFEENLQKWAKNFLHKSGQKIEQLKSKVGKVRNLEKIQSATSEKVQSAKSEKIQSVTSEKIEQELQKLEKMPPMILPSQH